MDNTKIIARFNALKADRSNLDSQLDLIQRFCLPFTGNFYGGKNSENEIDWRQSRDVFDATAVVASERLASVIHSSMASSSERWFDLGFRDNDIAENQEAVEWLEDTAERMFSALQESNFDKEIGKAFLYLVTYGYAAVIEEADGDDWDGLQFSTLSVRDTYFDEDYKKGIYALYRSMMLTPSQMIDRFGEDKVPQRILDAHDNPTMAGTREEVIFCIFHRDGRFTKVPAAPTRRKYGFKFTLVAGGETIGDEGGYYEMPSFIARWRETADSRWGSSPAHKALPTILTLNQLTQSVLVGVDKEVDPPVLISEDGVIGDLTLEHGQLNVVRNVDQIKPFVVGTNFAAANDMMGRLQNQILEIFHQDVLQLKESPAMTATEVNARREDMFRFLAPTGGLIQNDLLTPTVERTYNIMSRANRFLPMPESLKGLDIDIEFTGPLPRSQKQRTSNQIKSWLSTIAQLAEIYPDMMDVPDIDKITREFGALDGVPVDLMKTEEEVTKLREDRAAAQAKQAEMEQGAMNATALRDAGAGAKSMKEAGDMPDVQ